MITDGTTLYYRADGAAVCKWNGMPCSIRQDESPKAWGEIQAYLAEHPEALVPEPVPPEPTSEQKAAAIRARRNALLAQSDWTVLPDSPCDPVAPWMIYRKALRDITEQAGFPGSVEWPAPPK